MNHFVEVMKQIAVKAVNAEKPVNIMYGTVISTIPLKIKLSQQQILTQEFFLALESLSELVIGDKLILIRVQGGQQYLILGKGRDI